MRAPVLNASLTDCVFELQRETTAEEVNALFAAGRRRARWPASSGYETPPAGQRRLRARHAQLASSTRRRRMVTDGTLLKVYAWYDNEMGYACRMVDLACHLQRRRHLSGVAA